MLSGLFEVPDNAFGSLFMGELRVDAELCTLMDYSDDIWMSLTGKIVEHANEATIRPLF